MNEVNTYMDALYDVKRGFLIIGLTGFTGAGCSTIRSILEDRGKIKLPGFHEVGNDACQSTESVRSQQQISKRNERIFNKLGRTWGETDWQPFVPIKVSTVIFIAAILASFKSESDQDEANQIRSLSEEQKTLLTNLEKLWMDNKPDKESSQLILKAYETADKIYDQFKSSFARKQGELTQVMQNFGDDLRAFGAVYFNELKKPEHQPKNLFKLPEALRRIIKAYRDVDDAKHFVIDAFRNPFEIEYFKWRYSEFYLLAVLRDQEKRHGSLNLLSEEKKILDERESKKNIKRNRDNVSEWIGSQDLEECISKGDYFVENIDDKNKDYPYLKYNLAKLVCLAKNPGCLPPSQDERAMQMAMTARQMSGCISRRVGASVTNDEGYLIGFGWNDPPRGQPACSLRTAKELLENASEEIFSEYERSSEFKQHIKGKCMDERSFCFRSEYAILSNDGSREFTRALHAEENAFFQAIKNSRHDLIGATLYTTDQPCNLCSKKAYQLGIKRIVFIQEYPGIAIDQTIKVGTKKIIVERFQGVVGAAFFKLFTNLMSEKDIINIYMHSEKSSKIARI